MSGGGIEWLIDRAHRRHSDPIFFHFLNRELLRTLHSPFPPQLASKIILSILTCTRGPHHTTLSFLLEGGIGFSPELSFLEPLVARGMLDITSDAPSLVAHVSSHRPQYRHDERRYAEYYDENLLSRFKFYPTRMKRQDTTVYLSDILTSTFSSETAVLELPFPGAHLRTFSSARNKILDVVSANDDRGITVSLFKNVLEFADRASIDRIGHLISYFHLKHYLDYCDADICTSLPIVSVLDIAARERPFFDWLLFRIVCDFLFGYEALTFDPGLLNYIAYVSGKPDHNYLVRQVQTLISGSIYVAQQLRQIKPHEILGFAREFISGSFRESSLSIIQTGYRRDVLEWSNIVSQALRSAERNSYFKEFMQMVRAAPQRRDGRVLILTANDIEIAVALESFRAEFSRSVGRDYVGTTTIYPLGRIGRSEVFLAQGAVSDEGVDSISMKTIELIENLSPDYIILSGICLGLQRGKQKLGDIILSRQVRNYNLVKIVESDAGDVTVIPRGDRVPASPILMDRFRTGKIDWKQRVEPGLFLSGSILSNSKAFVQELLHIEPEALAAEMEGAGLYAACSRKKIDWVIVKSICDWGYNKDDQMQREAAVNSIRFVYHVIRQGGLFVER